MLTGLSAASFALPLDLLPRPLRPLPAKSPPEIERGGERERESDELESDTSKAPRSELSIIVAIISAPFIGFT